MLLCLRHRHRALWQINCSWNSTTNYICQIVFVFMQYYYYSYSKALLYIYSLQGHERDIIVLSLVRHNRKSNVGFLKDRTRQVVALSRQKRALCIIGCHPHFNAHSPSWKVRILMHLLYRYYMYSIVSKHGSILQTHIEHTILWYLCHFPVHTTPAWPVCRWDSLDCAKSPSRLCGA